MYLFGSFLGFVLVCWYGFICRGGVFLFVLLLLIVLVFWYRLFRHFVLGFLYSLGLFGFIVWVWCVLVFVLLVEALKHAFWWLFLLFWVCCVCVIAFRNAFLLLFFVGVF